MTNLDKRVEKLEELQPETEIARAIVNARSLPIEQRTPTSEIAEMARKYGGFYTRILQARRQAGLS